MSKTVLFQAIQFSISTLFSSIWPIDITLSDTTIPDKNGAGSDFNKGVPLKLCITRASPTDCLVSYQDTLWDGWVLPLCRDAVGVFYGPSQLGHRGHLLGTLTP